MSLTVEQANILARTARTIAHSHYVNYCQREGVSPDGLTGHKTWTKRQCLEIMRKARDDIERYSATSGSESLDTRITILAQKLGINGSIE